MNMKDKTKLFNIPNCLCYFRILLIPVFLFVYFNAQWQHHYIIAAFILVLSGISDCLVMMPERMVILQENII